MVDSLGPAKCPIPDTLDYLNKFCRGCVNRRPNVPYDLLKKGERYTTRKSSTQNPGDSSCNLGPRDRRLGVLYE